MLIAQQIRDFLTDGTMRNAVNLPAIPPEQYRRLRPYLDLAERLASFLAQSSAVSRNAAAHRVHWGDRRNWATYLLRSAALAGVLNAVLDEHPRQSGERSSAGG